MIRHRRQVIYSLGEGATIGLGIQIDLDDNEETPRFVDGARMVVPLN